MRRIFINVLLLLLLFFIFIITTDLLIILIEDGPEKESFYATRDFRIRTWKHWLNKPQKDFFQPPYSVFSNTDIYNDKRLKMIVNYSKLPPSKHWISRDFLLADNLIKNSDYQIFSNSHGYRGPERAVEKKINTKRIFVFGSYHAFGHGVDNKDTYSLILEKMLNEKDSKHNYEVWNGGRHAGTAIMGLARLKMEAIKLKPDLIIWDYGFVDGYIWDRDDFFPSGLHFPKTFFYDCAKSTLRFLMPLISYSRIFYKIYHYLTYHKSDFNKHHTKSMANFKKVNKEMIRIAINEQIPVILYRQPNANSKFKSLKSAKDNIFYVNGKDAFEKFSPSESVSKEFYHNLNWTHEFQKKVLDARRDFFNPIEYHLDYYHFNRYGHHAIAEKLTGRILSILN